MITKYLITFATWCKRASKGGLWIEFKPGGWHKCSWCANSDGYINNHYTGGVFHKSFKNIVRIQEFPYGERVRDVSAKIKKLP